MYVCMYVSRSRARSGRFKFRSHRIAPRSGCKHDGGSDDDRYDDDSDDDDDGYVDDDVDDVPTIPILFAAVVSDRVRGSQVLRGRVIYYRHV